MNKPIKVIVHMTGVSHETQPRQFFAINRYHRDAKDANGDWRYHYGKPSSMGYYGAYQILIEMNGSEWRYRKDYEVGAHTKGQNDTSLAVALAGNFDREMPTPMQIVTLKKRLKKWKVRYNINEVQFFPHRKYSPKTCYGSLLSDEWAQKLLKPEPRDIEKEAEIAHLKKRADAIQQILLRLQILINKLLKRK